MLIHQISQHPQFSRIPQNVVSLSLSSEVKNDQSEHIFAVSKVYYARLMFKSFLMYGLPSTRIPNLTYGTQSENIFALCKVYSSFSMFKSFPHGSTRRQYLIYGTKVNTFLQCARFILHSWCSRVFPNEHCNEGCTLWLIGYRDGGVF